MPVQKTILSITAFDNSGGAGLSLDLRLSSLLKVNTVCVSTAYTWQSNDGVQKVIPVDPELILKELFFLYSREQIQTIRLGVICTLEQTLVISRFLEIIKLHNSVKVFWDPVLSPTKGEPFSRFPDYKHTLMLLLPLVDYCFPNYGELIKIGEILFNNSIKDSSATSVIENIKKQYKIEILCTTDICTTDNSFTSKKRMQRILYSDNDKVKFIFYKKKKWKYSHGTGCAFCFTFAVLYNQLKNKSKLIKRTISFISNYFKSINKQ